MKCERRKATIRSRSWSCFELDIGNNEFSMQKTYYLCMQQSFDFKIDFGNFCACSRFTLREVLIIFQNQISLSYLM